MASVQPPNPLPPDQNVGPILLGISGTCLALVIITTSVRIWVRTALRSSGWDDYTIVIVTLLGIASAYWTGIGECWNPRIRIYYIYATIAFSILTDLICSLLPVFVIWNTSLPLKTKISVWALMSLGLVATGFGIARATSLGVVTSDLSWVYAITAIWSNLELYLGIVGANLALSRSIFAYFFREGGTTKGSSYGGMPRSTSASRNLRVPSSSGFRSGQSRIQSRDQDSEISLVQTTKKQPSTCRRRRKAFPTWKKIYPKGFSFPPAAFIEVAEESEIATKEIFSPVPVI
nr:hypothetical protein FVER53263_12373 [Fusarium verticillioides]